MLHNRPAGRGHTVLTASIEPRHYVTRIPTGIYSRIVCHECEQSFKRGDDVLLQLLRTLHTGWPIPGDGGKVIAKVYPNVDVEQLHRGILATLFRAHHSDHHNYKTLSVEPYTEALRQLLLSPHSTLEAGFHVLLRIIEAPIGALTPNPYRQNLEGLDVCHLYFPHITAYIKLDPRSFIGPRDTWRLRPSSKTMATWDSNMTHSELKVIGKIMATHLVSIQKYLRANDL